MNRFGVWAALLTTACFSAGSDFTEPERRPEHSALILDAGAAPADAGPMGDAGPGDRSCESGADCGQDERCVYVMLGDGQDQVAQTCQPALSEKAPNDPLIEALASACADPNDQRGPCESMADCSGNNMRCLDGQCREDFGPCMVDEECTQRNSSTECLVDDAKSERVAEALVGRCAPSREAVREGLIGFWVGSDETASSCAMVVCDAEDPATSCAAYSEGSEAYADSGAIVPVCRDREVIEEPSQDGSTCDWRECTSSEDCLRKYHVDGAECADGWWRGRGDGGAEPVAVKADAHAASEERRAGQRPHAERRS